MNIFLKASAAVLVGLLLCLLLSKNGTSFSLMITVILCCSIFKSAAEYIKPIFEFTQKLSDLSGIDGEIFAVLLKSVGISFITEIVSLICQDAGYGALGKSLQILSNVIILCLSIPLFNGLINIIESILEHR